MHISDDDFIEIRRKKDVIKRNNFIALRNIVSNHRWRIVRTTNTLAEIANRIIDVNSLLAETSADLTNFRDSTFEIIARAEGTQVVVSIKMSTPGATRSRSSGLEKTISYTRIPT